MRISVIGGDTRLVYAAQELLRAGFSVSACRLAGEGPEGADAVSDPREALLSCDAALLPIPTSRDGVHVQTVGTQEPPVPLSLISGSVPAGTLLFGGNFSAAFTAACRRRQARLVDLLEMEEFVLENAYLTAEAAIGILLRECPVSLRGMPVAVVGYGRIGFYLAHMLAGMSARVTVVARNATDRTRAALSGYRTLPTDLLSAGNPDGCTVICNTVPAPLFTRNVLSGYTPGTLILELASGQENVSVCPGIRCIRAPGLPGLWTPVSAGYAIAGAMIRCLAARGEVPFGKSGPDS